MDSGADARTTARDALADHVFVRITEELDQLPKLLRILALKAMAVRYESDLREMAAQQEETPKTPVVGYGGHGLRGGRLAAFLAHLAARQHATLQHAPGVLGTRRRPSEEAWRTCELDPCSAISRELSATESWGFVPARTTGRRG